MAWKAYLDSIQDNPVPNDTVSINVKFEDATIGKSFIKGYTLHAANVQSLQSAKDMVLEELAKLNQFVNVVDVLKPLIGKEIK